MSGQVATSLSGMPTVGASPYSFVLLDRDPNVPGLDTLYVADDRVLANGGGIQKWTSNGATWTLAATFTNGLTSGVRGLAGGVAGQNVILYATTTEPSANKIVQLIDNGAPNPQITVLVTAGSNTAFRGVAIAPH